jgi:hypothetical protein
MRQKIGGVLTRSTLFIGNVVMAAMSSLILPLPRLSRYCLLTPFCWNLHHITIGAQHASGTNPRSLDLSGVQITIPKAGILSDVFTIEWGLRKLTLRECDLDEHVGVFAEIPLLVLTTTCLRR